jgi:hypothetical protein
MRARTASASATSGGLLVALFASALTACSSSDDGGSGTQNDTGGGTSDTATGDSATSGDTSTTKDGATDPDTAGGDAPKSDGGDTGSPGIDTGDASPGSIWHPTPGTSWQWQITGTIDTTVDAKVFDIDLFDSSDATITTLHAKGRKIICYFDTAYEPGRPDSSRFTAAVLGNDIKGWPGQKWVDIRSDVVKTIMTDRMDLAVKKHCDGVEPDDVDGYANDPGFPLTAGDTLVFLRFLSKEAHARGLAVGLKNDLDQVTDVVGDFDFAVNEECFKYSECDLLKPFITARKSVFQTEYGAESLKTTICPKSIALDFDTLIKNIDLDAWRVSCR